MNIKNNMLKKYWNFKSFLKYQEDIIDSIINGNNIFVALPTGAGKSLCYQLPSTIIKGLTLVISPLISIMEDQVYKMNKIGIPSFYFKSDSNSLTIDQQISNLINGNYRIVYCSPERLTSRYFLEKIKIVDIKHIAVDEAHCISEWGHGFRPAYRSIKNIINLFPMATISAYSGSATLKVKKDIISNLGIEDCVTIDCSYKRKNIFYETLFTNDKMKSLLEIIRNESSIIYCNSRGLSENISKNLCHNGFNSDYFHGGLSRNEKKEKLRKWQSEEIKVIVGTSAFGMGVHKSQVRHVVHFNIPNSIEEFYQEAGRCGRDGEKSKSTLLTNLNDKSIFTNSLLKNQLKKKDLIKVYKNLTNFFQIPYGYGEGNNYDFDLSKFTLEYKLDKSKTKNILTFLEMNGLLLLKRKIDEDLEIKILCDPKTIKTLLKKTSPRTLLLESICRKFPKIYSKKINVSTKKLNQITKIEITKIYDYLKFFKKNQILDYASNNYDYKLNWLKPREDKYSINHLFNKLNNLNDIEIFKANKILDYIFDTNSCKSKKLLSYFGEKIKSNCNNCNSKCCLQI